MEPWTSSRPVAGGGPVCKHMCREFLFILILSDHRCSGKYEVDFAYPGNKWENDAFWYDPFDDFLRIILDYIFDDS